MLSARSEDSAATTVSTAVSALEDQQFNPAKVFVGGLGQFITAPILRQYFETSFGRVIDCAVVYDRVSGRSRGFGFVVFEQSTSADACVANFKHQITEFSSCEVRRALPRDDMIRGGGALGGKIFVSGLPEELRDHRLKQHFEQFGIVDSVCVKFNRLTSKSRGFGFVIFREKGVAEKALGKHPELGPLVEAKLAEPKRKTPSLPAVPMPMYATNILSPPQTRVALLPLRFTEPWNVRMILGGGGASRRYSPY